ncbi:MAG: endo-1,4-beta-xylanase [Terriglobales bacterium]
MNRRDFLCVLAASALAAGARAGASPPPRDSLRQHAGAKGIVFGCAAVRRHLAQDEAYARLVAEQCQLVLPANELKWDMLQPKPGEYDFAPADWMLRFAESHGLLFRGHALLWEPSTPDWVRKAATRQNARQMLTDHIRTVVSHYKGKMHSWDVVNEILEPADGRADMFRNSLWLDLLGADWVELAFHTAHEADPNALLVYNENWLESDRESSRAKRQRVLALLAEWKRRNVPVQALGLQAHLLTDDQVSPELPQFVERVADLGLKVLVTELDVRDRSAPPALPPRDRMVAGKYYEFLSAVLASPAVVAIITWGLSDRYTWINHHDGSRRADRLPSRPLPFDNDFEPSPAWQSMARAFDHAPHRNS